MLLLRRLVIPLGSGSRSLLTVTATSTTILRFIIAPTLVHLPTSTSCADSPAAAPLASHSIHFPLVPLIKLPILGSIDNPCIGLLHRFQSNLSFLIDSSQSPSLLLVLLLGGSRTRGHLDLSRLLVIFVSLALTGPPLGDVMRLKVEQGDGMFGRSVGLADGSRC